MLGTWNRAFFRNQTKSKREQVEKVWHGGQNDILDRNSLETLFPGWDDKILEIVLESWILKNPID